MATMTYPQDSILMRGQGAKPCGCPTCTMSRGIDLVSDGLNAEIERAHDLEGNFYYLLDEVEKAVASHPRLRRARLAKALRVVNR